MSPFLTIPVLSEEALLSGEVSRVVLDPPQETPHNADLFFEAICQQYPDLRVEQNAQGQVSLMPPEGNESSYRNTELVSQLSRWAKIDGRGVCFGTSTAFYLADGSKLGPDAAWVSIARLQQFPREQRRRFLRLTPEFVIELKSPTDSWPVLQRKMLDWRRNGVELGWLIDADKRVVLIYTLGTDEPTVLENADYITGSGPVAGFRLEMKHVWRGLDFESANLSDFRNTR